MTQHQSITFGLISFRVQRRYTWGHSPMRRTDAVWVPWKGTIIMFNAQNTFKILFISSRFSPYHASFALWFSKTKRRTQYYFFPQVFCETFQQFLLIYHIVFHSVFFLKLLSWWVKAISQIVQGYLMCYLHLEDVFLRVFAHLQDIYRTFTCILNHYILETSSKRLFDICRWANTLKNTSSRCK